MTWRKLLVRRRAFHAVVIPVADVHAAPRKYGSTVMPPGETPQLCSGALLRSDGGEGRPALLDILATAVRADDVSLLMFGNGQTLRECFLAGVTEELVVGH